MVRRARRTDGQKLRHDAHGHLLRPVRAQIETHRSEEPAVPRRVELFARRVDLFDHLAGGVRVELSPETVELIAQLLPATSLWAASEGQGQTGGGDVVALAVAVLHAQVFGRALDKIAAGEVRPSGPVH